MSNSKDETTWAQSEISPPVSAPQQSDTPAPGHSRTDDDRNGAKAQPPTRPTGCAKLLSNLAWTPPRCRYDPANPPRFTLFVNFVYAFAGCFTVANLYWNQPVLNKIGETFGVSDERASSVATLMQSGYAGGLLFLCPAGDMVRRRPFILSIISAAFVMWIGLCVTDSFRVFQALSFLCGFASVTPQLLVPLVGDVAPAHRRASRLSIVVSGLMLGMLVARLLSGIVSNYTGWRGIYWLALGMQGVVAALLFWLMPDYPATNRDGDRLRYAAVLADIARLPCAEPLLAQMCVVGFCMSATFTSFWTTLTFLLSGPPYGYDSLAIGLFALIGVAAVVAGPVYGRTVTDRIVPWYATVGAVLIIAAGAGVSTGISTFTVAGPILHALGLDVGVQMAQVANRTAIFGIDAQARNRINTAYMLASFCGQLTGTSVANRLFAQGGWRLSSGCSLAFSVLALVALAAKGPRTPGWIGWGGSWRPRVDHAMGKEVSTEEEEGRAGRKDQGR